MTNYASAAWNIEDIRSYREDEKLTPWTDEQAETFLKTYETAIADAMVEQGWTVIGEMMDFDLQKRNLIEDGGEREPDDSPMWVVERDKDGQILDEYWD